MAHYKAHGRLHLADTRDQAAESAVQAWAQLTSEVGVGKVALIADSSNKDIDRLNARAQHLRAQRGELGPNELPLSSVHYGLRQGDRVALIAQHRPQGQPRVENGTRGQVTNIDQEGTLTLTLDGSDRRLQLARHDAESLRLAYAQHVYRQQGATVDRSVVLTGGWQTSKESAYVQATRARHGTDWYLARDQLGEEGQDPDRITRLAGRMNRSRAQTPSVVHREIPGRSWDPSRDPLRLGRLIPHVGKLMRTPTRDAPDHDLERGR
jgi:ATP-dependent exoDNAse (exonuclease V) alpha subunit